MVQPVTKTAQKSYRLLCNYRSPPDNLYIFAPDLVKGSWSDQINEKNDNFFKATFGRLSLQKATFDFFEHSSNLWAPGSKYPSL